MLEVCHLDKRFGGLHAVDDVSFTLERGKLTSLMGANGAGKTTLFNLMTGYEQASAGDILLEGQAIGGLPAYRIARLGVGRSFQENRLFEKMSVLDNVQLAFQDQAGERLLRLFARPRLVGREARRNRTEALDILNFVGLGAKVDVSAADLSYGQQKLLAIARILAMKPKLMLLDEPTAGVHPRMIDSLLRLIRQMVERGITLCLIEHNWDVVRRLSDQLIVLDSGRIVASGEVDEVAADPMLAKLYLGVEDERTAV